MAHEVFNEPLSHEQADSLLRRDFTKALKACDREISLCGTKRLAMAHFIYAKGVGSFNKSKLKEKVVLGENIEKELLEWATYKGKTGKIYPSAYSLKIRLWELGMYNR